MTTKQAREDRHVHGAELTLVDMVVAENAKTMRRVERDADMIRLMSMAVMALLLIVAGVLVALSLKQLNQTGRTIAALYDQVGQLSAQAQQHQADQAALFTRFGLSPPPPLPPVVSAPPDAARTPRPTSRPKPAATLRGGASPSPVPSRPTAPTPSPPPRSTPTPEATACSLPACVPVPKLP